MKRGERKRSKNGFEKRGERNEEMRKEEVYGGKERGYKRKRRGREGFFQISKQQLDITSSFFYEYY